jgi:hypothetical protein
MDIEIKPGPTGQGITPQMPVDPPQEVKDMTFSFDPELMGKGGETTITTDNGTQLKEVKTEVADKPEEVIPKEDSSKTVEAVKEKVDKPIKEESVLKAPKEENIKPSAETKVKSEPKQEKTGPKSISPAKDHKDQSDQFDYSKYAPQEVTNMRNMSRQSREAYAKLIDENKQLATLKDGNYLQHEQAYTLSPDYQQLSQRTRLAQIEGRAWEKALLDIKAGKAFREITGFDPKSGQPTFAAERVASDADEIRIANNLTMCIQASQKLSGELNNYPQQFRQRVQQDFQQMDQIERDNFAWVSDPKLMEHTVEIEGQGSHTLNQIKENFMNAWPAYMRNLRPVQVAANEYIAIQILKAQLHEAKNGKQIAEIKHTEISRGEPSSDDREIPKSGDKKGIPSVFTLDAMPMR